MRAVLCKEFGPPSSLVVEDIDDPVPGAGEVLVRVEAAGLNFFDTLIIRDMYQVKPPMPFSPGAELAGTVEALGGGVDGLAVGDKVVGHVPFGACAEKAVVPAATLVRRPAGVAPEAAAGLIVTYGTTLHAFKDRAKLQAGETVAVLGAAGGIGQSAVEVAKLMGARVIACASSDEKLAFCREHGADETINYTTEDLKSRMRDLSGGKGVDVVYDPVGGDYAEPALRSTGWGGRYLVIGFAAGKIPKIPLNLPLLKGSSLVGVFWGSWTQKDPEGHRRNVAQLLDWVADGSLKPHVHQTYALEDTPKALDEIAGRRVMGKVIITP